MTINKLRYTRTTTHAYHIMLDYFHKLPKCVQANIMSFDRRFYWDHKSHSLCVRSFIADVECRFDEVRKLYKYPESLWQNPYIPMNAMSGICCDGSFWYRIYYVINLPEQTAPKIRKREIIKNKIEKLKKISNRVNRLKMPKIPKHIKQKQHSGYKHNNR